VTLRSVKYDGALNYEWPARVLWEDAKGFVWHAPRVAPFRRPARTHGRLYDWVGWVRYDRWYMVDASLLPARAGAPAGVVHHYYCNIGTPGAWESHRYRFVDLDLDVLVWPDGGYRLLDEDELERHSGRYGYPSEVVAAVRRAADEVITLARTGAPPFDGTLAAYHQALYGAGAAADGSAR
jgi:hypothetical protein